MSETTSDPKAKSDAPASDAKKPAASKGILPEKAAFLDMTVEATCVRPMAGKKLYPVLDEDDFTWLLPYAPPRGSEIAIGPGSRQWLETGLRLDIPEGMICRLSFPLSRGKPGMWVPVLELDHRCAEREIVVPVRNEAPDTLFVHPGHFFLAARFERVGSGYVRVEMEHDDEDDE